MSTDHLDDCLLCHHEEQLADVKGEIHELSITILSFDLPDDDVLNAKLKELKELRSQCALKAKYLLSSTLSSSTFIFQRLYRYQASQASCTTLWWKHFELAIFLGTVLNFGPWPNFIDKHRKVCLSTAVCQERVRKQCYRWPSTSSDNYAEAIASLKSRYDRPQLIHQAHVKVILDTPRIKDESGKELRRLHDEVQQHLRALRSMGQEPSRAFVTSVLELKLDQTTLFEW